VKLAGFNLSIEHQCHFWVHTFCFTGWERFKTFSKSINWNWYATQRNSNTMQEISHILQSNKALLGST